MRAKIRNAAIGMMANKVLAHMRKVAYETPINYSVGESKDEELIRKAPRETRKKESKENQST